MKFAMRVEDNHAASTRQIARNELPNAELR